MRVNDIFVFEKTDYDIIAEREVLLDEVISEGFAESYEEAILFESNINRVIKNYAARYSAGEPPEIMVFQDRTNPRHIVVLGAGSGMFYRFDVINDKVISEERFKNFRDLMDEKEILTRQGTFGPVDERSYLKKNWKTVVGWLVAGTLIGGALILAWVMVIGPALAFLSNVLIGSAVVLGGGWIAAMLNRKSASDVSWNMSGGL